MTKSDLVDVVANKAGLPKAKVLDAIDALTDAIQGALNLPCRII
jgi:nucleoid DNA-binding protein